jgi:hypothetical protein
MWVLSSVVGGEGSWWASGEDVDVHCEGECEEVLRDALFETGEGLGEVFSGRIWCLRLEHTLSIAMRTRALTISPVGRRSDAAFAR